MQGNAIIDERIRRWRVSALLRGCVDVKVEQEQLVDHIVFLLATDADVRHRAGRQLFPQESDAVFDGEGAVLDGGGHLLLQLQQLELLGQLKDLVQLGEGLLLKINLLLVEEAQEIFEGPLCCALDNHSWHDITAPVEDSRSEEDVLEIIAVNSKDDLVRLIGGNHLVLLVKDLEGDVTRNGGEVGPEQGGDLGPVKVERIVLHGWLFESN